MIAVSAAAVSAVGCEGPEIENPALRDTEGVVEYPYDLWDRGVEGTTMVRVLVNEAGGVDSAMVAESSGAPALDSAAVAGALRMVFEPGRRGGQPVRVWTRMPIHFLKEEAVRLDSPAAGTNVNESRP
ncbi:MAG: energy transducer TonB [Gemmatimonadetes bacterium]|nr:energy transducer TonB [Gemmatimonadota bacterium]